MAWTDVAAVSAGNTIVPAWGNSVDTAITELQVAFNAKCHVSANQSITDASLTLINPWDSVIRDPLSWSIGTGQIRPTIAGDYVVAIEATLTTATNTVTRFEERPLKNGVAYATNNFVPGGASLQWAHHAVFKPISMNGSSDVITVQVFQSSGSARSMDISVWVALWHRT